MCIAILLYFCREFTKGFSVQDENMLEIVLTRSNAELRGALDFFTDEYGTPLKDILSGHSYKNYREFMNKVGSRPHCSVVMSRESLIYY